MKFRGAVTVTSVVVGSAASLRSSFFPAHAFTPSLHRPFTRSGQVFYSSSSALKVSLAAEEEKAASVPSGKTVAEGAVVSMTPGGMCAVRINDDWTDAIQNSSPSQLNPEAPPSSTQAAKTSASDSPSDLLGRNVIFPDGSSGVVVVYRPPLVFVYSEKEPALVNEGHVKILDSMLSVPTSSARVVDCFGRPVDDDVKADASEESLERAMFAPIPQLKDISLINSPMLTGITMVDALAPIGRGQNMLLVGHDLQDMRGFAIDFLQTQVLGETNTTCVYAAVDNAEDVTERLRAAGIEDGVTVVAPNKRLADDKGGVSRYAEAVSIAGAACAIGEAAALEKGVNSLVVIDTIDMHKKLWDATTRELVQIFGVDAVVKSDRDGGASSEMRAFYSSLIQRAGQFNERKGGGSVTLLLLITVPRVNADGDTVFSEADFADCSDKIRERIKLLMKKNITLTAVNLRKLDIPIPSASEGQRRLVLQHVDDVISMTDGQIWLDERLEEAGQQPPMNPQRSVTRVGIGADTLSRADAPALRRVVEGLRMELSQAANMEGAEETKASKNQIRKRNALLLAMHQTPGSGGRRLSESCAALLAASNGYLNESVDKGAIAGTEEGKKLIDGLMEHVQTVASDTLAEIDDSLDLSPEAKNQLIDAISSFFASS